MTSTLSIASGALAARVAPHGGELMSLVHRGVERLWHGDPAWWDYRAPLLFPVIGRSPDDRVRVAGVAHPMPGHGFARDRDFAVLRADATSALLEQRDDAATRAMFPFAFALRVGFEVAGDALAIAAEIANRGDAPMPFGFGYHPGFLWPAADESRREDHVCRFEKPEDGPVRRARSGTGLLLRDPVPRPFPGRTLTPVDAMFERGSLQFEAVRSRWVWFGPRGGAGLRVAFPDSPQLGVWTRPGAPYLCIEPWQGLAEAEGADGELAHRPGARVLAPGASATYRMTIACGIGDPGDG